MHEILRRITGSYQVTVLGEGSPRSPSSEIVDGVKYVNFRGPLVRFKIPLSYLSKYSRETDILIDHSDVAIPWLSPLYARKPRITVIHQLVKEIYYYQLLRPWADLAFRAESAIYRLYSRSRIVTSSESAARELIAMDLPARLISVVPPGYAKHGILPNPLGKRETAIVCISRLVRYKGIQYALQAYRKILESFHDSTFRIAGYGPYEEPLKQLSRSLGISGNVQFLGRISQQEKFDLLSRSRVAVFPSIRDGYGIAVVEANSVGTPVVGWNVSGSKDSILDKTTGLLAPFPDDGAFADRISTLLADDTSWKRFSESAWKWAQEHSWDKSAYAFEQIIEEMLSVYQK